MFASFQFDHLVDLVPLLIFNIPSHDSKVLGVTFWIFLLTSVLIEDLLFKMLKDLLLRMGEL